MSIRRRLRYGFAMVLLTSAVMAAGLIIVAIVLDRNLWEILFGDAFLAYELLIVLVVLFFLAFGLSSKESSSETSEGCTVEGVVIDTERNEIRINHGPSCKIGLFFVLIGLPFLTFGAVGILDGFGLVAIFDKSVFVTAVAGILFSVIGLFCIYFAFGAVTCWDQFEMRTSGAMVCTVKFLHFRRQWIPMEEIDGLCLVSNHEDRDGETVDLILHLVDRAPLVIATTESFDAMLKLQKTIAETTGIEVSS